MIPLHHIEYWSTQVPWVSSEQIEQDLVISRALIEIYQSDLIQKTLIFRGGTALHKLYLDPPKRYSEDIDFVSLVSGNNDAQISHIRTALDHWLGEPVYEYDTNLGLIRLTYTCLSTHSKTPLNLKIEINVIENSCLYDSIPYNYSISSEWIQKTAIVSVYCLEELLATKLRALYERRKSRDLFDLDVALQSFPLLDINKLIDAFGQYTKNYDSKITLEDFKSNLSHKMTKKSFRQDILPFLPQNERKTYDVQKAYERVSARISSSAW